MNDLQKRSGDRAVPSLKGIYGIAVCATIIGIAVVMALNMATPLEVILERISAMGRGPSSRWLKLLTSRLVMAMLMMASSCSLLCLVLFRLLKPISAALRLADAAGKEGAQDRFKARQRLINLPFMIIPVNIVFWVLLPVLFFSAAHAAGRIDARSAMTLGMRSVMVGFISSAVMSFWLESHSRRRLIPFFFPRGRLADVRGTARVSISRRIRVFFRLGSLVPMAIMIVTLLTLQWQVDTTDMTAGEYGRGILIFSLVLFAVFFLGSSTLNKLISRSIAGPVDAILSAVNEIKAGNYDTRIQVVSNDEIGVLGDAANEMIRGLSEREQLRDAFGKYVAPEVRDEILSGRIPLDGELREVTVMFADLRDFTPLTESNDPKLVVKVLNDYFAAMSTAVQNQSGLILQFLGDEIYAVFGAPVRREDHPARAFAAALEMQANLRVLNRRMSLRGRPELSHGIGIHTGEVVAANLGSPQRLSYLLVGDTVNLASRLQSLTKEVGAEILLSAETFARLGPAERDRASIRPLAPRLVKGKRLPVGLLAVD